jgi:hypothetical protein
MAIINFAENVMSPLLDDYQQIRRNWRDSSTHFEHQRAVIMARYDIVQRATPEEFKAFWREFKDQKVDGRKDLLVDESEKTAKLQMDLWMVDRDELVPHPEWENIPSPYDVGKTLLELGLGKLDKNKIRRSVGTVLSCDGD